MLNISVKFNPPYRPTAPRSSDQAVRDGFALWHEAMRWQRALNRVLRPIGLTHTQYLILASVDRGFRETRDAVSQRDIAELAGLDESTVSRVTQALERRGLTDREPSYPDARLWRVILGTGGERILRRARPLVEAAALGFFADNGSEK